MKFVDPDLFLQFTCNNLPKEKMKSVEQALLQNGTANVTLASLMIDYETPPDADDIIGPDEENDTLWEKREKFYDDVCSKMEQGYSLVTNNSNNQNSYNMNISKEDLAKVAGRYNAISTRHDAALSLNENLVAAYKEAHPEATEEQATAIVSQIINGCDSLTRKYHEALAKGFDANTEIDNVTKDMTVEQRFGFLANALAAVETLNVEIYATAKDARATLAAAIDKHVSSVSVPTEADCEALKKMLTNAMSNNTLLIASSEQALQLLDAAKDATTVTDFASGQYDDARVKAETALAMWLEYEDGQMQSIAAGASPETIAIGAATAVEEAKIMNDVANGSKTVDVAVKCLKILGGVALFLLFTSATFLSMATACAYISAACLSAFGTSTLACIATVAICLPVAWGLTAVMTELNTIVVQKAGHLFDVVTEKLRESVFPQIKAICSSFINWLQGKCNAAPVNAPAETPVVKA